MATLGPFAAAVIAGGQSRRLGRDKALMTWAGRRLIDRQVDLVRALDPSAVIISGRAGVDYKVADAQVVLDATPGQGPLGGLTAVLEALDVAHVVIVAVDLPAMTADFLRVLVAQRVAKIGVVPRTAAGWEPLAAVYPREILPLARDHLTWGDLALHRLVEAGVSAHLLVAAPVAATDAKLFRNVNSPDDFRDAG